MHRIESASEEEQRQHDEKLQAVATHDDEDIFAERIGSHSSGHLRSQLCREGENAQGQCPYKPMYKMEQQFLKAEKQLQHCLHTLGALHPRQSHSHGKGNEDEREHITFEEGAHDIIGHNRKEVLAIGRLSDTYGFTYIAHPLGQFGWQIARSHNDKKQQSHSCSRNSGEDSVFKSCTEDTPRVLLSAEC